MFGKRNPSQLLSASVKRPRISIGAESDEIDLDNQDEDLDVQLLDDLEEQEPAPGGPSVDATVVIEESEVNLKSVKRLRLLSERGGDLGGSDFGRAHGALTDSCQRLERNLSEPQVCGLDPGYDLGFDPA